MKTRRNILSLIALALVVVVLVLCSACAPAAPESKETYALNVAALNGPTGIGMVKVMSDSAAGAYDGLFDANYTLTSAPEDIAAGLISQEYDIACVPTNLAATLYKKTEGQVQLAALNTLGVLYVLEQGDSIRSISDLAGLTVKSTGEASMPEYIVDHVLAANGLSDSVTIEYLSVHSELATLAVAGDVDVCILPEPFVSQVLAKNPNMRIALSITDEWNKVSDATLSMGCIVINKQLLETDEGVQALTDFLKAYQTSAEFVSENVDEAAKLVVEYGIMKDEALAKAAIPNCNIVYIDGAEMKSVAEGIYEVLYAANPASVGGQLPDAGLYYLP